MAALQKAGYWARWVLFIPIAAGCTVAIWAAWGYVNQNDLLGQSYWDASTYYILEPLTFLALGAWIAPSKNIAVPITLTCISALVFGYGEHYVVQGVMSGLYSWNDRDPASGIPLSATLVLTIIGSIVCVWHCVGKFQERLNGSLAMQRVNLGIVATIFIGLVALYMFLVPSYKELPDGTQVDMLGRYSWHSPWWSRWFGEGRIWHGLDWFITERVGFWGGIALLGNWGVRLSHAQHSTTSDEFDEGSSTPREKTSDTSTIRQPDIDNRLISSIAEGSVDEVSSLLAQGASPNATTENGMSALMLSASLGKANCVELLISEGAEVNARMEGNGFSALMFAVHCESDSLEIAEQLVLYGADIDGRDDCGNTALMVAIETDKHEHAAFLISNGADIDTANDEGITALMRSCMCGTISCLELLFFAGADPFIEENEYTRTAVDLAAVYDNVNCLKFLMSNGIDSEEVLRLASMFSLECLEYLVLNGSDINRRTPILRSTPLMEAAEEGNLDCVRFLVTRGADVNAERGLINSGPLTEAATHGHIRCVEFLISVGANVNNDDTVISPLMAAVHQGNLDCVKCLVSNGADINFRNYCGETALTKAVQDNHIDCVKYLCSNGADVNARLEDGTSVLYMSKENLAIATSLRDAGARN